MTRDIFRYLRFGSVCLLFASLLCTCGPAPTDAPQEAQAEEHEASHDESGVHLSLRQITAMEIGYGELTERKVNDYLRATGTLGLPPNAYAAVNAPAAGYIRNSGKYVEGDHLNRGDVLAELENPDFIDLQRSYLEADAELTFLQQELSRQEELLAAEAGVLKSVQRLRSEVAAKQASVSGLRQRLRYIGIRTESLTPATIRERVTLFAPRSGFITQIALHDGMYVEPRTELMEIIDEDHLHLELDVFESDIARVERGQRVSYRIPALGEREYTAEVHVIGKEFDTRNKTVRVHAHLSDPQPPFIRDLFAEARIWLSDETVLALPERAVFRDGEAAFVYTGPERMGKEEVVFERLPLVPGTVDDGFVAVRLTDSLPPGRRIVTEGAYFVHAQSQAEELAHEH